MQSFTPLSLSLRAAAGLLLAPALTLSATLSGFQAQASAMPTDDALSDPARAPLMAAYFVAIAIFLPVYLFMRRYVDMSRPTRLMLLGAYSAWTAPVGYMLLLILWRGDFFNAFVLEASPLLLSPANALLGALGGFIFWLIAAAPAPRLLQAALHAFAARLTSRHDFAVAGDR